MSTPDWYLKKKQWMDIKYVWYEQNCKNRIGDSLINLANRYEPLYFDKTVLECDVIFLAIAIFVPDLHRNLFLATIGGG